MSRLPSSIAFLILSLTAPAEARETVPGPLPAEVVEVVDGDTIGVRVHVWLGQQIETRVRLLGIDAPELRAHCAEERQRAEAARDFLVQWLARREVVLREIRHDKYGGRVLARVATIDGRDIAGELLARGLVRPYDGHRRTAWCNG